MVPMALTSDGTLLLNMAEFQDDLGIDALVHAAKATGLVVFVGVVVPGRFQSRVRRDLDDAARDLAGRLGPEVVRTRRSRT